MKILLMVPIILALAGCGAFERYTASITGYSRVCVDGVSYLQFTSGATVEYRPDGSIKRC